MKSVCHHLSHILWLSRLSCTVALLVFLCSHSIGQDTANVIPFQGQLANQAGQALTPTNAVTLVFRLYQQPVGGVAIWEESQPNISVNAGRFSVLLGSRTQLPGTSYFNSTLYLGITVDDGNPATDDIEMRPRQALVPVISASYARNADKLQGYDWSAAFGTNNPLGRILEQKLPIGVTVPVGGVIMWWGNINAIPDGFEICDGSAPTSPGALLTGLKPDLRDRFPKGAISGYSNVQTANNSGGANTIPDRVSGGTALTESQMPAHYHQGTTGNASVNGTDANRDYTGTASGSYPPCFVYRYDQRSVANAYSAHTHNFATDSRGGNQPHTHSIPGHDNRPAFLEMFFIIRVK